MMKEVMMHILAIMMNRYDNDENYRDGVDDMLDELGE